MIRFLERLNTLKAMIVVLALCLVIDGSLYYRFHSTELATPPPTKPATPAPLLSCSSSEVDFFSYSDTLDERSYEGTKVGGLSGLDYDPSRDVYFALADSGVENTPARFYTLKLPLEQGRLADPVISDVTILRDPRGKQFTGANFDGEGIAVTSEGELLISSESEPSIRRFSLDGRFLGELTVPQKFLVAPEGYAQANASFESLELSPNGSSLFTANEQPLVIDGQGSSEERQRVHLLRYEAQGSSEFEPSQEFSYLTEPGESVSEIVALSENELLILERGTRQIFRVSLDEVEDVSDEENHGDSSATTLQKELLVDVDDHCPLPSDDKGGSFGLLEGMSLGPELPGGRRTLLLLSDDDFTSSQKTRVIVIGIRLR